MNTRRADPYAGANIEIARQFSAPVSALGVAVVLVLLPFYPPTHAVGTAAGWIIVGALLGLGLAFVASYRRRPERFTFGRLLVQQYFTLLQVLVLQWLGGGHSAPYGQLLPLVLIGVGFTHPPRRVAAFALATILVSFSPLAYQSGAFPVGEVITQMAVWIGITATFAAAMVRIRGVRTGLRVEADMARRKALVDELTQLGNRAAFDEACKSAIATPSVHARPLSLLLIDVDDFKQINDRHGHIAGDEALRAIAGALREGVREPDACFRWGGDEFAVLLAGIDADGAAAVAERVCEHVMETCRLADGSPVIVSCGSSQRSDHDRPEDLLADADHALLARKTARRAAALVTGAD